MEYKTLEIFSNQERRKSKYKFGGTRTLYKKDWLVLMFLLLSFMTSIYSIMSNEIRLVTHFSVSKTITLHKKAMLYVSTHDFRFFAY